MFSLTCSYLMFSLTGESNRTTSFTVKQYSIACVWLSVPTACSDVCMFGEAKETLLIQDCLYVWGEQLLFCALVTTRTVQ